MKNVLLVDDNKKILELLRTVIPWNEAGFNLEGLAENGKEALGIAAGAQVDILVTDIKMPVMDGLELIRRFRKAWPDTKILALSAYNEFNLVREAFKLGASEYILKTELDAELFIKLLNQFSEEIDSEKEERDLYRSRSGMTGHGGASLDGGKELFEHRRYIKDRLLNQLIYGHIKADDLFKKDLKSLGLKFIKGYYRVMLFSIDNFKSLLENVWNGDEQLFSFAVLNIIDEILNEWAADSFYTSSGELAVICYAQEKEEIAGVDRFREVFGALKDALLMYLKVRLSAGICAAPGEAASLRELYESACQACRSRFIYGQGKLLCDAKAHDSGQRITTMKVAEKVEYLRSALKSMNPDTLRKGHEILCLQNREINIREYGEVTRLFEKYSMLISEFAEINGLMDVCGSYLSRFDESNYDTWPVEQLNHWLMDLLSAVANRFTAYNDAVRRVIHYVRDNYSKDISLQSTAEEIGINRSYLSRLIKRELGATFSEYLNNFRIEKAKELIACNRYKLYEIAEKCGYSSFEHFSRMFKKIAGASPSEWDRN